jgi:hypothetical protein
MTDVSLFLRQGWKHIWKQNNIFLFSSLMVFTNFMYFFTRGSQASPFLLIFIPIIGLVFSFANTIGVPFLAYRFLIGNPAGIRETFAATREFSARVIGCSCLVLLMTSPILLIAFFVARAYSSTTNEILTLFGAIISLIFLPFGCFLDFCLFGYFGNNDDINQGLKKAWSLLVSHFWTLTTLSVVLSILGRGSLFLATILTLLVQGDLDLTSLREINLLNPGSLLTNNLLYLFISGVGSIILMPFSSLVYGSAYLKYMAAEKIP